MNRKIRKLVLINFIVLLSSNVNAQWIQQNSGTTNFLMSIQFPTNNVGYVLAETGYVRKTTNGGSSWNLVGGQNDMWGQIYFTSIDTGFATGARGVLKTMNGGVSWVDNFPDSVFTTSLSFISTTVGYAAGSVLPYDTTLVYKTNDGGTSWNRISSVPTSLPSGIQSIYFLDNLTGFLINYADAIYKSVDGGLTWVQKSSGYAIYSVQFPSPLVGYAVGDFDLLKTTDGGETWIPMANSNPQALYSVFFTDDATGYIVGGNGISSGAIEKTTNSGSAWSVDLSNVQTFNCVYFHNANVGYACGTNGVIYKLDLGIGINDVAKDDELTMYPNPATNELTIESKMQNAEIEIRDVLGQMVYSTKAIAASSTIDVSMLSKGVYFISLQNGKQTINKKLVKE